MVVKRNLLGKSSFWLKLFLFLNISWGKMIYSFALSDDYWGKKILVLVALFMLSFGIPFDLKFLLTFLAKFHAKLISCLFIFHSLRYIIVTAAFGHQDWLLFILSIIQSNSGCPLLRFYPARFHYVTNWDTCSYELEIFSPWCMSKATGNDTILAEWSLYCRLQFLGGLETLGMT